MSNSLLSLISKETKEMLRDPRIFILMIVAPILIFILLGTVMGYATEKTVEATASGLKIAVIDEDGGEASKALIQFLRSFPNSTVDVFTSYTDPKALLLHGSYDAALVIQPNFTSNILFGREAQISSYEMVRDLSISAGAKLSSLPSTIGAFQQQILLGLIAKAYPQFNITSLSHMISLNETAILGGREYSMSTVNSLLTGSILLVLAPIMVFSIGTSLAASSMGIEKEEKTLEILLTLPIKRSHVLLSKVVGAFILSLAGMVGMMIGLFYYLSSIISRTGTGGLEISETLSMLTPATIIEVGFGLLLSLLFLLAASILLSTLANNVREAQAMASYAWIPIMIPYILLMYIDFSQLGTVGALAVSLIPASTPLIAIKASLQGWSLPILVSFVSNLLYFGIILYAGARWFEGERILSARLSRKIGPVIRSKKGK